MGKTINEWASDVYNLACEKGWHSDRDLPLAKDRLGSFFMNLHCEISEAWEAFRDGKLMGPCDKADAMIAAGLHPLNCLEEELADVVIRVFDMAKAFNIDIERAIEIKHAYNKTRSYRHGGKLA